ncbi:XdhC family protein [Nocardia sp. NEAU-351]|uniref:XdhC family protein n=2 Tax=Nocardia bovistercoris TaxID=2785916 RepID=A0A931MZ92_9NOCA|nr:XdhC family protein [Nocardia bovistercoris]
MTLITNEPVALARVVETTGAGPRLPGAAMIVTNSGTVLGSLSGGCVEAAVIESARTALAEAGATLDRFDDTGEDEFAIGLPCGGEMTVFVERVDRAHLPLLHELRDTVASGHPIALATTLTERPDWTLLRPGEDVPWHGVDRDARALLRAGRSGLVGGGLAADPVGSGPFGGVPAGEPGTDEPVDRLFGGGLISNGPFGEQAERPRPLTFVHSFATPPRMILTGANDFVRALSRTGGDLGYRVTVVDARATFATRARFPAAHQVVVDWPHRYFEAELAEGRLDSRTVVCVMSHDDKFDVPMLAAALPRDLTFVGAIGSRRTHAARLALLRAAGVGEDALRRLRSPLGLDLNARTPEETAISIAAHILAVRDGGSGRPLEHLEGPIHR